MNKREKLDYGEDHPEYQLRGHRIRHDGWNLRRSNTFLIHLAATGCVREAAWMADMSKTSAYRLYKRDPDFADLWDMALRDAANLRGLMRSLRPLQ